MLLFAFSEMLAWASAQIHCQFHASENRVALPPSDGSKHDVQAENETVFVPNRGEHTPACQPGRDSESTVDRSQADHTVCVLMQCA